ncbi:major facilitator superfamily domain-containing protein [Lipomyces tetrasporus]|uniref:Major facilitator superfamily domain-containing protein n=1 Tax=Lipomyces tetrasporus TaxID=54092 RepID=A0AAD7QYA9_9ASCO|nr:major facilitator superfamily domain-containing protein [Lipomyces tetrasporus]KAJ8103605.1 major facilitator superfamily domain-containing protein [Lipomyces tetrasporus]
MPVAVHDVTDEISNIDVELVAVSAADPQLVLHRNISREKSVLVKVPTPTRVHRGTSTATCPVVEKSSYECLAYAEINSPILIDFEPGDPTDPRNFTTTRKYVMTAVLIALLLNSTFASSVTSGASNAIRAHFGSSTIVTTLLISLFMVGFVIGPLFWAPMSEHVGRRYIVLSSFTLYFLFTVACALAPSMATLIGFRFLQGLCATCPIAVSGGVFADIYSDPIKRGRAVALFCGSTIMGSLSGPFIAGYISTSYLGWRWVFWITAIWAGFTLACTYLVLPETFRPLIIMRRAQNLRRGGQNVVAAYELQDKDLKSVVLHVLLRPINMLFKEMIVAAICVYVGFTYGLLYMFFQAYPVIFQQERGMSPGKGGLMLLPIGLGAALTTVAHYAYDIRIQRLKKIPGKVVSMELERLPVTMVASWFLPVSLFWLAWTSYNKIPFAVTMLGGIFFGLGFTSLFIGFLNYATDCYKIYAASAHGIMSVTRSMIGASLPLVAPAMYEKLGVRWATTIWALISLAMAPIPILFFKYGHILRQKSTFASALASQDL